MERVTITIDTTNQAFEEAGGLELARILQALASEIPTGSLPTTLRDVNGNTVGSVEWTSNHRQLP